MSAGSAPGDERTDIGTELTVLALNSGSSSLKFGLYRVASSRTEMLLSGEAESIGERTGRFSAWNSGHDALVSETTVIANPREAIVRIGKLLADSNVPPPSAIGHRVVHGGPKLREHCLIDDSVLEELAAADVFAPLHMAKGLSVIRLAQDLFPGLPQAACFDTAFHAGLPDVARVLLIPKALQSEGIQRYGFHDLSYESIVCQLAGDLPDRLVIAHLGNGASVTAVKRGKSIDTSMGLTPTGGLIMGTRSGARPGCSRLSDAQEKFDADRVEELVDHRSGLLGISGVSRDMRQLHEAAASNADARLAIAMFCYAVRKQVAGMLAALDGVDTIVFTLHRRHRRKRRGGSRRDLRGLVVDRCQPRRIPGPVGQQSHPRRPLALCGSRARLAGRRADRPPHGGPGSAVDHRVRRLIQYTAMPNTTAPPVTA